MTLAFSDIYGEALDDLVRTVRALRAKYPESPEPFRTRMQCPKCMRHSLERVYSLTGELEALECTSCRARREF